MKSLNKIQQYPVFSESIISYIVILILSMTLVLLALLAPQISEYGILRVSFTIGIFIIFLTLFFVDLRFQFIFFIAAAPLLVFLEVGQEPFQWNELFILAMLGILLLEGSSSKKFWWIITHRLYAKIALIFFIWTFFLSLVYSKDLYVGLVFFVKNNIYIPLLILTPIFLDRRSIQKYLIPLMVLPAIGLVIYGLVEFSIDVFIHSFKSYGLGGFYRATSVFSNPNGFAIYVASITLFLIALMWLGHFKHRWKIVSTIFLMFSVSVLIFTFSRRAMLSFILSIPFVLYFTPNYKQKLKLFFGMIVIGLILYLIIPNEIIFNPRIEELFHITESRSLNLRLTQWDALTDYIFGSLGNLLIGLQPGVSFLFAIKELGMDTFPVMDCYYATLLANYGLIAFFTYLSLIFHLSFTLIKKSRSLDTDRPMIVGCLVGFSAILIAGIVGNVNMTFPNSLYLWLFPSIGITLIESKS